jgi:hypothetical protein
MFRLYKSVGFSPSKYEVMMENFRVYMKIIAGSSLCNYLLISISQNRTLYSCDFFFMCYGHFEVTS